MPQSFWPRHGNEYPRIFPRSNLCDPVVWRRFEMKSRSYGKAQDRGPSQMNSKKETNQMRIAVPTDDGTSIAEHFGRSAAFLIFQTEDGRIAGQLTKANHSKHMQGSCGQHSAGSKAHSHAGILSALKGCEVVICAGMGSRAADALKAGGVTEIIVTTPGPAEAAVSAFLDGKLSRQAESFCSCHH